MEIKEWGLLPLFALLFFATWLTRGAFLLGGEQFQLPEKWQLWLRYAPSAALGALIAPELLLAHGRLAFKPELLAALAVALTLWRWRNPWAPFAVGMGVLLIGQSLLGW